MPRDFDIVRLRWLGIGTYRPLVQCGKCRGSFRIRVGRLLLSVNW